MPKKKGLTYKDAGVDIDAAEEALKRSKVAIESTYQPHVLKGVGLFGGMVDFRMATRNIKDLALFHTMQGESFEAGEKDTHLSVTKNVIHQCLNHMFFPIMDVDSHGISFLDYIASSKLKPLTVSETIAEMAKICSTKEIPIIGGETAEMPGIYREGGMEIIGATTAIAPYHHEVGFDEDKRASIITYYLRDIFESYQNPVLVQSIDGVGTKTMLAVHYGTNVEDLVSHCVNDIAVQGAKPLFMMIYADTDVWRKDVKKQLQEGTEKAEAQAELKIVFSKPNPDVYQPNQIDLVGCITGVVEREKIIDGSRIEPGDRLIGLASSGPHTNGYSLIRKIIKLKKLRLDRHFDELGCTLGEAVREPHRSYLKQIQELIKGCDVKGFAHITGGGLVDNVPRIIPDGYTTLIDRSTWQVPKLFQLLQEWGNVHDMWRTFNMGIGLVAVVPEKEQKKALNLLECMDQTAYIIGTVQEREKKIVFTD